MLMAYLTPNPVRHITAGSVQHGSQQIARLQDHKTKVSFAKAAGVGRWPGKGFFSPVASPPPPAAAATAAGAAATKGEGVSSIGDSCGSTVAYQGVSGAYGEVAALQALPGWTLLPCNDIEAVLQALTDHKAEEAVVPIEYSLGSSNIEMYDLIIDQGLHIVAETLVEAKYCLLALPGVQRNELHKIMSHPQALAQCNRYLGGFDVDVLQEKAVFDTAGAAKMVADSGLREVGAIASARAAELYGLDIVEEDIQDNKNPVSRFVVLAREPLVISDPDAADYKTSIAFRLPEGPGMLNKAISVFGVRDINLTNIESRTLAFEGSGPKRHSYQYHFLIDFDGCTTETSVQEALKNLEEHATMLRVLGSYPKRF